MSGLHIPYCPNEEHKGKKYKLINGGDYNKYMFCPKCGQVYQTTGNFSNQPQPDWEIKQSRIKNTKMIIANHIEKCDLTIVSNFVNDYIDSIKNDFSKDEIDEIKDYAKIGCFMKLKES